MGMFEGRDLACLRGERLVFAGVDFTLQAGDALLVTGPNGSGKSSLLRIMASLILPVAGTLEWRGRAVAADREAFVTALRYVGHLDAVKPTLTVAENLAFWVRLAGQSSDGVARGLDEFGLGHLAALPARVLSAGQRRRLGLARLVAAPAPLWLLDEPTVALDGASVAAVEAAIADHRAQGGIAVVSTNAPVTLPDAQRLVMDNSDAAGPDPAEALLAEGW